MGFKPNRSTILKTNLIPNIKTYDYERDFILKREIKLLSLWIIYKFEYYEM